MKKLFQFLKAYKRGFRILYETSYAEYGNTIPVRIVRGKYAGTVYKYGKVSFNESADPPAINFEYEIIDTPIRIERRIDKNKQKFINHIGDILVKVIADGDMTVTEEKS